MKCNRLTFVLAVALLMGTAACGPTDAIAVVNQSDESFYLRFEGQWVWVVPPRSRGIGPVNVMSGGRQTQVLRMDCSVWASWGLPGPTTIVITDTGAGEPDLLTGVRVDGTLTATDECVLR